MSGWLTLRTLTGGWGPVRNPRLRSRSGAVLRIFDAHVHLFDCAANTHAFLEQEDPTFRYIIGDY